MISFKFDIKPVDSRFKFDNFMENNLPQSLNVFYVMELKYLENLRELLQTLHDLVNQMP